MRHHAQFTELLVDSHITHHQQPQGKSDTKRHASYHHYRVGCTRNTYQQVIVNHIVHKIYQRHTGDYI